MQYLILPFLIALVNAQNCPLYQNLFNTWDAVTSADLSLRHSEIHGKTYVAGTAYLQNFALGRAFNFQACSGTRVISANRISATEGNFCGGVVEANTFVNNMYNTGSDTKCDYWTGIRCGTGQVSGVSAVCFCIYLASITHFDLDEPLVIRHGSRLIFGYLAIDGVVFD